MTTQFKAGDAVVWTVYGQEKRGTDQRTYKQLRRDVIGGHDCLMLHWAGMWLGIERDGYTHS